MALLENGQSCLENIAIRKRPIELNRNEYSKLNEYNCQHENAQAGKDPYGKGVNCAGHTFSVPDCTLASSNTDSNGVVITPPSVNNIITYWKAGEEEQGAGSCIDVKGMPNISHSGRNANLLINNYGYLKGDDYIYGTNYVNTSLNVEDGQEVVGYRERTEIECNP